MQHGTFRRRGVKPASADANLPHELYFPVWELFYMQGFVIYGVKRLLFCKMVLSNYSAECLNGRYGISISSLGRSHGSGCTTSTQSPVIYVVSKVCYSTISVAGSFLEFLVRDCVSHADVCVSYFLLSVSAEQRLSNIFFLGSS